jgi:hypothetical protein
MSFSGSGLCSSFKAELLVALHNFARDTFMMALYDGTATLSLDMTTTYVTEGEIAGPGYQAGGMALKNPQILGPKARTVFVTWDDPIWTNSTFQARGALIYNRSKGQRAVAILDFLTDRFSNTGDFRVKFPPPGPGTALIRIS